LAPEGRPWRFWLVIAGFLVLVGLLAVGLRLDPREVPSPLIGKPAPAFELPLLQQPDKSFSQKDMLGTVWVMNVWASWCPPCLVEHPVVSEFARSGIAPVVGLNYKDAREDALPWLKRNGDPFKVTVFDAAGRIAIDYGVYGVPETYVIDRKGIIRYKRVGPLTPEIVQNKVRPLIEELSKRG
jgi:cytochrome c biogenesis protein CcmG/thiol:disulfide interchange protein DsbE